MIRFGWVLLVASLATLFYGTVALVAAALRVRGRVYFWITQSWANSLVWASRSRINVHGMDGVDWNQPHVLVANHVGSYEILAIAVSVPVPYHFVAKKELERVPLFGPAWKAAGHISIDRDDLPRAVESLNRAADCLRSNGGIVIIFPEGTRSPDGDLQPFKKGAFQLAIAASVPIIPAVVVGSEQIREGRSWKIRPGTMDLHIGQPIPVDGYSPARVDDLIAVVHGRMRGMLSEARHRRVGARVG